MLTHPPLELPPALALAQAALRASLSALGVDAAAVRELETGEGVSPSAFKVYEGFLASVAAERPGGAGSSRHVAAAGAALRPETLMPAARRAAHHISHLLREQAAARASYLRNVDCAETASVRTAQPTHPLHIVLDNLRSAYNVGSIFRTADAAHCREVVTCGFTPHPPHPKLSKTGFGAVESVATRHFETTLAAVRALQASGVKVYCMETTEHASSYADIVFPEEGAALVMGNEEIGVDVEVMAAADGVIEIPCFGAKNSLNVCSAASIVVFEALRQWGSLERDAPSHSAEQPPCT